MSHDHCRISVPLLCGLALSIIAVEGVHAQAAPESTTRASVKRKRTNLILKGPVRLSQGGEAIIVSMQPQPVMSRQAFAATQPANAPGRSAPNGIAKGGPSQAIVIVKSMDPTDPAGGGGGWVGVGGGGTTTTTIVSTGGGTQISAPIPNDPTLLPLSSAMNNSLGVGLDGSYQNPSGAGLPQKSSDDGALDYRPFVDPTPGVAAQKPNEMNLTIGTDTLRYEMMKNERQDGMTDEEKAEHASNIAAFDDVMTAGIANGSDPLTAWHDPKADYRPSGNSAIIAGNAAEQGAVNAANGTAPLDNPNGTESLPAGFASATGSIPEAPTSSFNTSPQFVTTAKASGGEVLLVGYQAWVPIKVPLGQGGGGTNFGDSLSANGGDGVLVNPSGVGIAPAPIGTGGGTGVGGGGVGVGCVPAGTPFHLADGSRKPIEAVAEGDLAEAYDDVTWERLTARVMGLIRHENRELFRIVTDIGELVCSHDHRLAPWDGSAFPPVRDIRVGDVIRWRTANGIVPAVVTSCEPTGESATVYHVSLDRGHVYVAGDVPAHNKAPVLSMKVRRNQQATNGAQTSQAMIAINSDGGGGWGVGGGGTGGGRTTTVIPFQDSDGIGVGGPGWTAQDVKWINIWLGPYVAPSYNKTLSQPMNVDESEVVCAPSRKARFDSFKKVVVQSEIGGVYYAYYQKVEFYGPPVLIDPNNPPPSTTDMSGMPTSTTVDYGGTGINSQPWPPTQDMIRSMTGNPNCNYADPCSVPPGKLVAAWDVDFDGIPDCWDSNGDGAPDTWRNAVSTKGGQVPPCPPPTSPPDHGPGTGTTGGTGTGGTTGGSGTGGTGGGGVTTTDTGTGTTGGGTAGGTGGGTTTPTDPTGGGPIGVGGGPVGGGGGGTGPGCVPAGTPFHLADGGRKPIEAVMEGDFAEAYDDVTWERLTARVIGTLRYDDRALYRVITDRGELVCSHDHRLASWEDAGFPPARHVKAGDVIRWRTPEGIVPAIVSSCEPTGESATVYHVSLDRGHVYVAGDVPAHNSKNQQTPVLMMMKVKAPNKGKTLSAGSTAKN